MLKEDGIGCGKSIEWSSMNLAEIPKEFAEIQINTDDIKVVPEGAQNTIKNVAVLLSSVKDRLQKTKMEDQNKYLLETTEWTDNCRTGAHTILISWQHADILSSSSDNAKEKDLLKNEDETDKEKDNQGQDWCAY